ncbi:MAG: peptidylprolyl isomerase [candidate division Zixibacteria bacterium]|nr:peptidylprolyl isomerase [candidate division Zixibacteria bacterium]
MFEFLRKLIFPIIIIVLIFFTGMIVLEWGADFTRSRSTSNVIGVINGEEIPWQTFERVYNRLIREEQDKLDYDLPTSRLAELRDQAWQEMLVDYLMNQQIKKYDITVTSEELFGFLRAYPPQMLQTAQQFQTDGKFDPQKYAAAMINPDNAPFWASVEQYVLPDIQRFKLQQEIISTIRITPAEVQQAFMEDREEVKIGYLYVPKGDLTGKQPEPTDEDAKAFYDENLESYAIDEQAVIRMANFELKPSQTDWDREYALAREVYDSAVAGVDFGELAQVWSMDGSAANGGDLDWFERGRMVAPFDSAVWSMEIDQISPPVKTQFGWHIIKLLGIKTEKKPAANATNAKDEEVEMRHAAHILLRVEASQETIDQIEREARDFAEIAKEKGFDEAAEEYGITPIESRPFTRDGYIQSIGINPKVSDFALDNPVGTISDMFTGKDSYFVFKITEHIPAGYKPFEEMKNAIMARLRSDRVMEAARDTAQVIHKALEGGMSLSQASRDFGFPYAVKDKINRNSVIPNIGKEPLVMATVFALQQVDQLSQPTDFRNGVVIFKLVEKASPTLDEFEQVRDSLETAVLYKKQNDVFQRWFESLMQSAKVENYIDEFYRGSY